MYKITQSIPTTPIISANEMKIGDLAIIRDDRRPDLQDHVLLRTYSNFVSLLNPDQTWDGNCSLKVILLPKGSSITLTVE